MINYLFTIYVTGSEPPHADMCGQRTLLTEAIDIKGAFLKLSEHCQKVGYIKWFVVYVFAERIEPFEYSKLLP